MSSQRLDSFAAIIAFRGHIEVMQKGRQEIDGGHRGVECFRHHERSGNRVACPEMRGEGEMCVGQTAAGRFRGREPPKRWLKLPIYAHPKRHLAIMMILRYTPTSPHGRTGTMAANELGLMDRITIEVANTDDPADSIRTRNPLGKIPCLIPEDEQALYDCLVILEYLDLLAGRVHPFEATRATA